MTILTNTAEMLISQFGEVVTVRKTVEDSPDNSTYGFKYGDSYSSEPIYFEKDDSVDEEFDHKVRLFDNPDEETLNSYGFEQNTETTIYTTEDVIENGNIILYRDAEFVVNDTTSMQIGQGPYRYVHGLVRRQ